MASGDSGKFSLLGFLARFALALLLVLLTYNPGQYAYVHWVRAAFAEGGAGAVHALAGVALLIGWTIFLRTAWAALGALGLLLGSAFMAAFVWVLTDMHLIRFESGSTMAWVLLVCIAALLAVGMSWGLVQRRASGQVDVDEVDQD